MHNRLLDSDPLSRPLEGGPEEETSEEQVREKRNPKYKPKKMMDEAIEAMSGLDLSEASDPKDFEDPAMFMHFFAERNANAAADKHRAKRREKRHQKALFRSMENMTLGGRAIDKTTGGKIDREKKTTKVAAPPVPLNAVTKAGVPVRHPICSDWADYPEGDDTKMGELESQE